MPKVSFASSDFYEPKLGFQEGWFEITDAKTQVFQYPPNKDSGEQTPPFLAAILTFQRTDEQGKPLDEEPQEKALRIEKDLAKMRPGQATSRTDPEPSDQGDELDTIGNCIYAEEGVKINKNSAWAVFCASLEAKGFKAEIIGEGYLPDLIGLKGHAKSEKGEKRNIGGRDVEPTYLMIDKITVYPYEGKAAKKGPGSATTNKPAAAQNGAGKPAATKQAAPATPAAAATAEPNEDADTAATALFAGLAGELQGQQRDAKKVFSMAYSRLVSDKSRDKKLDKAISELLRDNDWLTVKAAELDITFEDGVFTFGELVAA
jgi:hypothetical protein